MDKIISSLLCCSVDSKDDADDKIHNQATKKKNISPTTTSNSPATRSPPRNTTVKKHDIEDNNESTKQKKPIQKKDIDEENSVNETDTITNTNESNDTPTFSNHPEPAGVSVPKNDIIHQVDQERTDAQVRDEEIYDDDLDDDELYLDLTKLQDGQSFNPETGMLLGVKPEKFGKKKCLILDLDETLVHSSFKYLRTANFVIPVEIDNQIHHVYVIKRPGVDEFLKKVGQWFEVVVFTASVLKYGEPLLDKLDIHNSVHHRLFRDSCYNYQGNFIKNLSQIGRPLADSIIIDNSPASYIFHPQHSIPISSWFSDTHDNELLDLLPFLEDISKANVDDVGLVLDITL